MVYAMMRKGVKTMKTVRQVSKLTGLTPRALHHYDAIGLLKPTAVTEAGYRLYDDAALERLQMILLFRELEFPLKDIATMLDAPDFEKEAALAEQIKLLKLRLEHLKRLIGQAEELQKGGKIMDFQAFDRRELDAYAQEVKERWGNTAAYQESRERLAGKTEKEIDAMGQELLGLLAQLGALRGQGPAGAEAQRKVAELQSFISEHYYTCTKTILAGLGQMYVQDARMRENIDAVGGAGTAAFAAEAISVYVSDN